MEATPAPGQCQELVSRRVSVGVMSKGKESYTTRMGWCSRKALPGETLCGSHQAKHEKVKAALKARRQEKP